MLVVSGMLTPRPAPAFASDPPRTIFSGGDGRVFAGPTLEGPVAFMLSMSDSVWVVGLTEHADRIRAGDLREGWIRQGGVRLADSTLWAACLHQDQIEGYDAFASRIWGRRLTEVARDSARVRRVRRALTTRTLEDLEDCLSRYGPADSLSERLEVLHERALTESLTSAPTLARAQYYRRRYWQGADIRRATAIAESLSYLAALGDSTGMAAGRYYEEFPYGGHRAELLASYEQQAFAAMIANVSLEAIGAYRRLYPRSPHEAEIAVAYDSLSFLRAKGADDASSFGSYLVLFPSGRWRAEATARRDWLRARRAVVEVSFPDDVTPSIPFASGMPRFEWTTVVREIGGELGLSANGRGYIVDRSGARWGWSPTGVKNSGQEFERGLTVRAGSSSDDRFWVGSKDHQLCGGLAVFIWTITDAGGGRSEIREEVRLLDPACGQAGATQKPRAAPAKRHR